MRVAFVSSMQLGVEMGLTNTMTAAAVRVLADAGVTVRAFHDPRGDGVPGDELRYLKIQADAAVAWGPDVLLSIHVDSVGDTKRTGILMCVGKGRAAWAKVLGQRIAAESGYPFEGVRNTYGGYVVLSRPEKRGIPAAIVECGEYSTVVELAELRRRGTEIGEAIGRAVLAQYGIKTPAAAGKEEGMPIDRVSPDAAAAAQKVLITEHILQQEHPPEDAASVGLLAVLTSRLTAKVVTLEGRLTALEAKK